MLYSRKINCIGEITIKIIIIIIIILKKERKRKNRSILPNQTQFIMMCTVNVITNRR